MDYHEKRPKLSYKIEAEQNEKSLKKKLIQEQSEVAKDVLDKTITEYEKKIISLKEESDKSKNESFEKNKRNDHLDCCMRRPLKKVKH